MANGNGKLFSPKKRNGSPEDHSFFKRRQQARGVDWQNVNWDVFMQVMGICISENIGLGFYSASGGRGVCIKLYTGKKLPDTEYASTAEEVNELMSSVLESLEYKLEDGSAAAD